jgi:hypothetical protein
VAKKKKPSQLQRLQLPQHQQLPQLMQHLQQLLLPLLLAPLLLLQPQLQQHPHQPESNSLLKRKKPLQSGFFYILLLTYLISCSSNRVSKR